MASGSETISAVPSTWIHSPRKPSLRTHSETWGSRRRALTLKAVSRLLMTAHPSWRPTATGDIWGPPPRRRTATTARWWLLMNSRASSSSTRSGVRQLAADLASGEGRGMDVHVEAGRVGGEAGKDRRVDAGAEEGGPASRRGRRR